MFWGHPHALQSATASVQALLVAPVLLQILAQLLPKPSTSLQSGPELPPQRFEGAPPQLQQKAAQGEAVPSKRAKTLPTSPSAKIDCPRASITLRCALIASTSIASGQGLYSVIRGLANRSRRTGPRFPPSVSEDGQHHRVLPAGQRHAVRATNRLSNRHAEPSIDGREDCYGRHSIESGPGTRRCGAVRRCMLPWRRSEGAGRQRDSDDRAHGYPAGCATAAPRSSRPTAVVT